MSSKKLLLSPTLNGMPLVGLGTLFSTPGQMTSTIRSAVQMGYRHIDCAPIYQNEAEIGDALSQITKEGLIERQDLFIVSKLWNTKHHPDDVEKACRKSLRDLKLDYLDLYLIHWPMAFKRCDEFNPRDDKGLIELDLSISIMDTWKAMENLVDLGLVKHIGLSNFNSGQVQHILDNCRIKPLTNQVEASPLVHQDPLMHYCRARDVILTAYSPLGRGTTMLENEIIVEMAKKYKKTPAQIVLRWMVQRGIVVIPKSTNEQRMLANLDLFDFFLMPEDVCKLFGIGEPNRKPINPEEGHQHPDYPLRDDKNFF